MGNNIFVPANSTLMSSYMLMLQTDPDDRLITEDVLSEIKIQEPVKFLCRFDELPSFIVTEGLPSLILVSEGGIFNAIDIIRQLKSSLEFKYIPCVVLTEKSMEDDVIGYYNAGASTVIIKPSTNELTKEKIQVFFSYWLKVAELPGRVGIVSN